MDGSLICEEVTKHRKLAAPALFRGLREMASRPIPIDLLNGDYRVGPDGVIYDTDTDPIGSISVIKLTELFEFMRPHLDVYHDHLEDMMHYYGENGGDTNSGVIYEELSYVRHFNAVVDDGNLYIIGLDSDL